MGVLQYHIVSRTQKFGKYKDQKVYSAQPINHGKISFEDFCKELADGSTVDQADVKAVLSRIAVVVPRLVERGYSVDAGDLGTFRASFGSKQVLTEEDFKTELISRPRVVFTPRVAFKNSLRGVSFERIGGVTMAKTKAEREAEKKKKYPESVTVGGGSSSSSEGGGSTESPSVPGVRPGHNL